MSGRRRQDDLDIAGDYDAYGMPPPPSSGQRSSGIMNRLKRFGSSPTLANGNSNAADYGNDDEDDDVNIGPDQRFADMSMRDLATGLRDRHRYPAFDDNASQSGDHSRTMSITSMNTFDTTPIVPTLQGASQPGRLSKVPASSAQYRQKMIDSRRHLLSSETGLPLPQPNQNFGQNGRRPSMLSENNFNMGPGRPPFAGPGERTMSLGGQSARFSGRLSNASMGPVSGYGPNPNMSPSMAPNPQFQHMQRRPGPPGPPGPPRPGSAAGGEIDALRARNAQLHAELENLRNSQTSQTDSSELEAQYQQLANHVAALENENKSLMERNDDLEKNGVRSVAEDSTSDERYDELLAQYNGLLAEHSQMHQEFANTHAIYEKTAAEHTQLLSDHENTEVAHNDLLQQHQLLQQELQRSQAAHDQALEEHKQAILHHQQELTSARADAESLQQHIQEQNQQQQASLDPESDRNVSHDQYTQLQEGHRGLTLQLATLQHQHQDLSGDHENVLRDLSSLRVRHDELRSQHDDLTQQHMVLTDRSAALEEATSHAADQSETLNELSAFTAKLQEEVRILSIELAEASRRELGLSTTATDESLTGRISSLQKELNIEREKRLIAENRSPAKTDLYTLAELEHRHAEATQLLDIRNQQYDAAQKHLTSHKSDFDAIYNENSQLRDRLAKVSESVSSAHEFNQLNQHVELVRNENQKLQKMLDETSERAPLSDRLKDVEDQRDVLQDALRSLRERKDQEIRLLNDRVLQLEKRLENEVSMRNPVPVRAISGGFPMSSELMLASPVSAESSNGQDAADMSDDQLELPRLRNPRPASPLHLNFKFRGSEYFPETAAGRTTRADSRTSPLPLALGN